MYLRKILLNISSTLLLMGLALSNAAHATPFSGAFDPSNFVFNADGGNGSVDTSGAPNSIQLTGNNNDNGGVVETFLTTVGSNTTFDFSWNYLTQDDDPSYDPFGYIVNGVLNQLSDNLGPNIESGGIVSVNLLAGDSFGFYIDSTDGCCGRSYASFGDVPAPINVPEPATVGLLGLGLLGIGASRRRRQMV